MDCELRYVLVPRQPLREMRRQQALARTRSWLERLQAIAEELLRAGGTRLWD